MKAVLPLAAVLAIATLAPAGAQERAKERPKAYSATDAAAMSDVVAVEAGSCFRISQIRNHTKADASTLLVSVGSGKSVYRWQMSGACLAAASSSDPLILEPVGGIDVVCKPIDLNVKVQVGAIASPCIVKSIAKLTPEEVAALPKKIRP